MQNSCTHRLVMLRALQITLCLVLWAAAALPPAEAAAVKVFVSIPPQKYFVEKIGGELVEVGVLVPSGADAHTYEPKPRQMAELAKARIFFSIGIDFEKAWMGRIAAANRSMQIVATDEGVAKLTLPAHDHSGHAERKAPSTGPTHAPDLRRAAQAPAGEPDPHIWLSPPLVKTQARTIAGALAAADPGNRWRYEENLARFLQEIDDLDLELRRLFAGSHGARFMVFHPSWGYFAQAYGLEQTAIEIEGKDPKPAQLRELIRRARQEGVKVVFVQPQFSPRSAEMVAAEIGGQVVMVDPLSADWAENLRAVARKFRAALPASGS